MRARFVEPKQVKPFEGGREAGGVAGGKRGSAIESEIGPRASRLAERVEAFSRGQHEGLALVPGSRRRRRVWKPPY